MQDGEIKKYKQERGIGHTKLFLKKVKQWNEELLQTRSQWEEWIEFGQLGMEACKRINDPYSMDEVYPTLCNNLGIANRMLGNFEEAMSFYQDALEKAKYEKEKSDALTNMCDIYRLWGQTEQALKYGDQAKKLAPDKSRKAKALEFMGLTYVSDQNYDAGIGCYRQSLKLRRETGNQQKEVLNFSYLAFALSHRNQNKEDLYEALYCYEQAKEIEENLDNKQSLGRLKGDIAVAYNKLARYEGENKVERYEEAKNLSLESYSYNDSDGVHGIGYKRGATLNQARLIDSYLGLNELEKALESARYVCKNRESLNHFDRINLHDLSAMLIQISQYLKKRGKMREATELCEVAIEFASDSKEEESKQDAQALLVQLKSLA